MLSCYSILSKNTLLIALVIICFIFFFWGLWKMMKFGLYPHHINLVSCQKFSFPNFRFLLFSWFLIPIICCFQTIIYLFSLEKKSFYQNTLYLNTLKKTHLGSIGSKIFLLKACNWISFSLHLHLIFSKTLILSEAWTQACNPK